MLRSRRAIAVALIASGLLLGVHPAQADQPGHRGPTVRVRGDVVTVTVSADGQRYTADGISVQAAVTPRAEVVSCYFIINQPLYSLINGWPSIVNGGGADCRLQPTTGYGNGVPALMTSVSLTSALLQYSSANGGGWVQKKVAFKIWGPGHVTNAWYALPMATCVASSGPSPLLKQVATISMLAAGGATASGSQLSPIKLLTGCAKLP